MTLRAIGRVCANLWAYGFLAPVFVAYAIRLVGFETVSKGLSLIPGLGGMWLRRVWYRHTLAACGEKFYVDFLSAIRTPRTRIGHRVYIGNGCWVGWADIGDDVMLGGHIVILSGLAQHRFDRTDIPVSAQGGEPRRVTVGRDVWVGNGAIIGADVSEGTVAAAGSVVTRTFPPFSVLAGVPARVVGSRLRGEVGGAQESRGPTDHTVEA